MPTYTDAEKFLQAIFPDWRNRAFFAQANFPKDVWTQTRDLSQLDPANDCYVSIAAFGPGAARKKAEALEVVFLAVDDVGTKVPEDRVELALGAPTKAVQTSAGNQQWFYRLSAPIAVADWDAWIAGVEKLVGVDFDQNSMEAVHVFRVPMGLNTKKDRGMFRVHEVAARDNPSVVLDVASITPVHGKAARPGPSSPGGGAEIKLGLDDLRTLMGWIKNDISDRGVWVNTVGHGLKALCENDADGFTVFDEWSDVEKTAGYNRKTWDSLGAGGLLSRAGKLKALAQAANPDGFAKMFASKVFDDGDVPPPVPPGRGAVKFKRGKHGEILGTKENAELGLTGLGAECSYDEFHHRIYIRRDEKLTDHAVLLLRHELSRAYGKDFGTVNVGDAVVTLALLNGFNPVTDMLRDAEAAWDGTARLDRLGPDYFHTEDTELARECFRKVMIAAVRRARRPGCKFDQILVMESPEGWDKSSAWAVLAGSENFSDADILGKDARAVQEELADVWIHEIADLSGLTRAEVEHVKAFASRTNDRARPAYGRYLVDQPRQSIEVGTTNADSYLLSTTGNRRFWPFRLGARVELARLKADRLQLWGEAAAAEARGETLVLDEKLWGAAAVEQEDRRVIDPWEDELANLPDTVVKDAGGVQTVTNVAIHDHLGGHRGAQLNGASGRKISEIMKRLGWERTKLKDAVGKEVRGYRKRTDVSTSVDDVSSKKVF
jgi:hypothetical protein